MVRAANNGVSAVVGLPTVFVAMQLILRRPHVWLPGFLRRRSIATWPSAVGATNRRRRRRPIALLPPQRWATVPGTNGLKDDTG